MTLVFLLDMGPLIMGPTAMHLATLLNFPKNWTGLLAGFVLSYLINLVLAAAVLHFAGKDFKKDLKKFLLVFLATTAAIFLIEFVDFLIGIVSALAMFAIYWFVFTKKFGLTGKQAAAGAIAFAILTNPFAYFLLAAPQYNENERNSVVLNVCKSELALSNSCYTDSRSWNATGRVPIFNAPSCKNVYAELRQPAGENCANCASGNLSDKHVCFDDVNNPTYVCCGPNRQ